MRKLRVSLGHPEEMLVVTTMLDMIEHRARQKLEIRCCPVREVTSQQFPRADGDQRRAQLRAQRRRPRCDDGELGNDAPSGMYQHP